MADKKDQPEHAPTRSDKVRIKVDLGPLPQNLLPGHVELLKKALANEVLTWIKSDLRSDFVPGIVCEEFRHPLGPHRPEDDDDGGGSANGGQA